MVRSVRRDSRMASAAATQVAAHQGQVAGLDRDVGAGAHGQAEVGLGQRGGVVDAVAHHRHDAALGLEPLDDVDLVRPAAPRRSPRRCRPRRRRVARRAALSPVSSTGAGRAPRSCRDRLGAGRLDRVGDDEHGRAPRRPSRRPRRCRPPACAPVTALGQVGGQVVTASASSAAGRRAPSCPSTTPGARRGPRRWRSPSTVGSAPTRSRARRRRWPARSGARRRASSAPARRSTSIVARPRRR